MLSLSPMMPLPLLDSMVADSMLVDSLMADRWLAPAPDDRLTRLSREGPRTETHEDKYIVTITAPGVAAVDIECEAEEVGGGRTRLSVRGKTVTATTTHFMEQAVVLPPDADVEKTQAESADGLLTLTVPRKAAPEPTRRRIAVSATADAETAEDHDSRPYQLTVAAPGVAASDLEISAAEGMLTVSGATERTGARLKKAFRLPRDADLERATAAHVDGLLTVSVPKKAAAEALRIAINSPAAAEAEGYVHCEVE